MSGCSDYRRALLADPRAVPEQLLAHARECAECMTYAERAARFEARLARAMRLEVADAEAAHSGADVIPLRRPRAARGSARQPAARSRWLAIAASFAVAAATAGLLWVAVPRSSLAGDVVTHMAGEPAAWQVTNAAVPPAQLGAVLANTHMRLEPDAGLVSYASSCEFRGHLVPHLVVQDQSGPVTVMVLVHESVKAPVQFDEQHYRGVILPVPGHGAVAVLTRNQNLDQAAVDRIAARLKHAIDWVG
jgi:hypothetical protein